MKKLEKKINIMRKCKICEIGNIEGDYYICKYCGWESDPLQEENKDYIGGANEMSFNQYKKFCKDCKKDLQASNNSLEVIKLSIDYYKKNFQKQNEEILRKEEAGEIVQEIK